MPLPEIAIAQRLVGPARVPLVVDEIGINHGGSLQVAFEMVDAAARAGWRSSSIKRMSSTTR